VAIIKILKKKPPSPEVKEKRKAGMRAGLTKPAIAAAAAKLIENAGVNEFSLRKLAKAMGVGPTTIHFHFKRAGGGIYAAIVVQALAGVTRPFKPKEEPSAYLGELLFKILQALHARPMIAKFVLLELSANPVLDPLLAERLLLALATLGVPMEARPRLFQRAMGVIFDMILTESGRSRAAEQKQASARINKTIGALSPTEFPNLTELREALVAEAVQAGAAKPSPEVAAHYADRLIAALGIK
jgi:TetR/AcrR family transcriptional regulator, tetracycline repressor protein